MTLREQTEQRERETLSSRACLAEQTRGRARPEEPCGVRTCFQVDTDRIVYCKSFRRLKHKTQVFLQPEGDHYRTRMTHTLEVSRIARTIARGLALEKEGAGLNLTWEVRNGIERHTGGEDAATLEGQVVRLADKIAYINHDIEDALRGGVIYPIDIPLEVSQVLGFTHGERINALVVDAISASRGQDRICQSPQVGEAMAVLKEFMFANVYTNPIAKGEESKAQDMLKMLFGYYQKNPDELPADFQAIRLEEGVDRAVCDYIAGMTDPFAVSEYTRLFIPMGWGVK